MEEIIWDGITSAEALTREGNEIRQKISDAAKSSNWEALFKALENNESLINATRPGGTSWYAPLHQAAYNGAPPEVVTRLLEMGAWRTMQNAAGERAVDVAERKKNISLIVPLTPRMARHIPWGILVKMQSNFHGVILGRAEKYVYEYRLRLPDLEPLLEVETPDQKFWFTVPGMYGGFSYWLERDGADAKLITESWCRVVEGSGQRHEVKSTGSKLVAKGFV